MLTISSTSELTHLKNRAHRAARIATRHNSYTWFELGDDIDVMSLEFGDVVQVSFDYGRVIGIVRDVVKVHGHPIVTVECVARQGNVEHRDYYTIRNWERVTHVMNSYVAKHFKAYAAALSRAVA